MEDYLSQLNDQQRAAVEYCDGPQLVIAGAGSGKTRVLTYKIVHLMTRGIEPYRIMALTFTNKAAREMRERIETLVGPRHAAQLWMGTFHSIFSRILHRHADRLGFASNFTIYDSNDSRNLIKMIIRDMELDEKAYKPATVQSLISTAKNALIGPDAYAADRDIRDSDRRARRERMAEIYRAYVHRCHVAGAMDFDDLLYYTNVLFRDNADILRHYQEFFSYVLVDEYQDTNFAQHLIVSMLCEQSKALCVVGDDAQSIYSFRGANIRNILNLRNAYPDLRTFKLEQNYRSTQNIIKAANTLIAKNEEQIRKEVFSRNDPGERIEVVRCYSDFEEASVVANRIASVKRTSGDSYEEFAILSRTNAQSRVFEEALRKRAIPYRIYGGLSFYQRAEIKDAVAYFRLSVNPDDDEALRRVINVPARGIGQTTMQKVTRAAIDESVSLYHIITNLDKFDIGINKGTRAKLEGFAALIGSFIKANADGDDALTAARKIITDSRLMAMYISDTTPESISKQENLEELLNSVQSFVTDRTEEGNTENVFMTDFLSEVSLATDQDRSDDDSNEKVTLMTIHAAKGLEFSNIFVVGVEEDLLPSAMSKNSPHEIEEERRLLYVAITRAKKFCMMSYASSRYRNGQTEMTKPSRFLRDIDPLLLNFVQGTPVPSVDPTERYRASFPGSGQSPFRRDYGTPVTPSRGYGRTAPAAPRTSSPIPSADGIHTPAEVDAGMKIEHSKFGVGVILKVDTSRSDATIVVRFNNVDVKTLMLKYAKFKIL